MDITIYTQFAQLLRDEGAAASSIAPLADAHEAAFLFRAGGRSARPKRSSMDEAFLEAHGAVLRLEAAFAETEPRLSLALVALDGVYQRARADLRARTKAAPAPRALTGEVPEHEAVRAVGELRDTLTQHGAARWAQRSLQAIGALPPEIERALARLPAAKELTEALEARARAFGLASERYAEALARHDLIGAAGPLARLAPSDTSWTQAVVKVWNDDLGIAGSGVFVRANLVVTAAHVITSGATVDPSRVHVEIPARGSSRLTAVALPYVGEDGAEDYALIEVPRADVPPMVVQGDFDPSDGFEISRYGYPADGGPKGAKGHITRYGALFYTSDLHLPGGVSGGALAANMAEGVRLVGIGTTDDPMASDEWPMGIPLPGSLGSSAFRMEVRS